MSKLLQLVGLSSFTNPTFKGVVVRKKDVVRVDDAVAEHLMKGTRVDGEGQKVSYWSEHDAVPTGAVFHDLSTKGAAKVQEKVAEAKEVPKAKPAANDEETQVPAVKRASRQRGR